MQQPSVLATKLMSFENVQEARIIYPISEMKSCDLRDLQRFVSLTTEKLWRVKLYFVTS